MRVVERADPFSGESISILLSDPASVGDPFDHYREVEVSTADGKRFRGIFFRDPKRGAGPRGSVFWDDNTMILVGDLDEKSILDALDFILAGHSLARAMEQIDS